MVTLRIEHEVPNYEFWKQAFDSDPADRKGSGVGQYTVSRAVDNGNFVTIDLEFANVDDAKGLLSKMENIWAGPGGAFMMNPKACIVEAAESRDLSARD